LKGLIMEFYLIILTIAILFLFLFLLFILNRVIIFEYQSGLLYNNGKYVKTLMPGPHWHFPPWQSIQKVDMRELNITIPGQEVLSSDNVSLKISIAVSYKVIDPYTVINKVLHYQDALYQVIQLNVRDIIGSLEVDALLAKRAEIGKMLFEKTSERAAAIGVQLLLVDIKDIMFPGELKNIFAQVVNARKEGVAALERARGESAALRNLANTARLFDDNPNLRQLRLLQVLEKNSGNTVVVMSSDGIPDIKQLNGNK